MSKAKTNKESTSDSSGGILKNSDTNKQSKQNSQTTGNGNKPNKSGKTNQEDAMKKKFKGQTKGLEEHFFYYGQGMDEKYLTSKEHVLNYIGRKFSGSERVSIEKGKLIIVGFTYPVKIKTKADFEAMPYWQQKQWNNDMDAFNKAKSNVVKNLTACYSIIWSQLSNTLKNEIKREDSFAAIGEARCSKTLRSHHVHMLPHL